MKEETKVAAPEVAAHNFLESAQPFLAQMMGGEFDLKDFSVFSKVASGGLMGSMYAILRKEWGKPQAEAWLKETLSVASSWVRLHGGDAILNFKVEIKDAPNILNPPVFVDKKQEEKKEKTNCTCILSPKGRCEQCISRIKRLVEANFEGFRGVCLEEKNICAGCKVTQTDEAFSRIVPLIKDIAEEVSPEDGGSVAHQLLMTLEQIALGHGVTDLPLTKEAVSKLLG